MSVGIVETLLIYRLSTYVAIELLACSSKPIAYKSTPISLKAVQTERGISNESVLTRNQTPQHPIPHITELNIVMRVVKVIPQLMTIIHGCTTSISHSSARCSWLYSRLCHLELDLGLSSHYILTTHNTYHIIASAIDYAMYGRTSYCL